MSERIKAVTLTRICQMPSGKLVEDQKGQTVSDQSMNADNSGISHMLSGKLSKLI